MNAQATRLQTAEQTTIQDTRRVFGYQGGVPHLTMDARDSGLDSNPIKGGKMLLFVPGVIHYRGMFDPYNKKYTRHSLKVMPSERARTVANKFQFSEDFSYRTLEPLTQLPYKVTPDEYIDEAYDYFAVVHPIITCPFGLETDVVSNTGGNIGSSWYQACPTCRLKELQGDECSQRIFEASGNGMDSKILADTRAILIDSCQTAITFAERKVADIEGDMTLRRSGQNGRATRNEIDFIYLKMLHRKAVENSPSAEQGQNAIAEAITQGFRQTQQADAESAQMVEMKLKIAQLEAEKARWDASNRELAQAQTAEVAPEEVTNAHDYTPLPVQAEVYVSGNAGIVTSKHGGKYKVTFADGSTQMCAREELMERENANNTE